MKGLLGQERAILESLSHKKRDIEQLEFDIGISREKILNTLSYFILEEVVDYKGGIYSLRADKCREWLTSREACSKQHIEIIELLDTVLGSRSGLEAKGRTSSFLFRKVWLDEAERNTFERLQQNMEIFLSSVQEKSKKRKLTYALHDQQMVFFLSENYGNTLKNLQ